MNVIVKSLIENNIGLNLFLKIEYIYIYIYILSLEHYYFVKHSYFILL